MLISSRLNSTVLRKWILKLNYTNLLISLLLEEEATFQAKNNNFMLHYSNHHNYDHTNNYAFS